MQPKTELFLYHLLWSVESLTVPTFRNLTESFEGWAYRQGLNRQLATLEKQRLIERRSGGADARICRLTAEGRLHALGGRDPEAAWARAWDGRWRIVLFDLPSANSALRSRLRRYLRERAFGFLQNSVWITPDSLDAQVAAFRGARIDVESFILLEATPCAGESNTEIVAGAWDFERINRLYSRYLKLVAEKPDGSGADFAKAARKLHRWAMNERAVWNEAVWADPLLPEKLLPKGYLGQKAWRTRIRALREAGRNARRLKL